MSDKEDDAYDQLMSKLNAGETVEAIVFGRLPWRFRENPPPVGQVMTLAQAEPYMHGWEFDDGDECECPPMHIWTTERVFFVVVYDAMTWLGWVPREPAAVQMPKRHGGM